MNPTRRDRVRRLADLMAGAVGRRRAGVRTNEEGAVPPPSSAHPAAVASSSADPADLDRLLEAALRRDGPGDGRADERRRPAWVRRLGGDEPTDESPGP